MATEESTASGQTQGGAAAVTPPISGATPAAGTGQQASQQQKPPKPDAGAGKPQRPEGLPDQFWKGDTVDLEGLLKSHSELAAYKAEKDSASASAEPQIENPDDFKLELPKDFKAPDGVTFEIDEADPRLPVARDFAAKNKLTQKQFSDLLALSAQADLARDKSLSLALGEEIKALGTKGKQRVDAVVQWMGAKIGNDLANQLIGGIFTAKQVEAWEAIMKAAGGTVPSFSGANREQAPTKLSSEEYNKMTPVQQIMHAREQQAKKGR